MVINHSNSTIVQIVNMDERSKQKKPRGTAWERFESVDQERFHHKIWNSRKLTQTANKEIKVVAYQIKNMQKFPPTLLQKWSRRTKAKRVKNFQKVWCVCAFHFQRLAPSPPIDVSEQQFRWSPTLWSKSQEILICLKFSKELVKVSKIFFQLLANIVIILSSRIWGAFKCTLFYKKLEGAFSLISFLIFHPLVVSKVS